MKRLEAIIKSWILGKISIARPMVFELDGEYYLYRYSKYLDGPVYMAMVNCYKIFGLKIEEIILDRHNFDPFVEGKDDVKEFIIRHEIAHVKLKHHTRDIFNMTSDERLELEMEADAYAAEQVGYFTAYKSIKKLEEFFEVNYNTYDNEIEPRLKRLKRKIETSA